MHKAHPDTPVAPDLQTLLENTFTVLDSDEVYDFLVVHAFLAPLLFEAHTSIQKHFGARPVTLELNIDPEDETYQQLVLRIQTEQTVDKADALFEEFDQDWWLPNMRRARNRFNIMLQFV
ncbi:MAG: hypothetical protein HC893_01715 [Chloroflexaceae bacterium]|nr:hypothetical protein [Chloroflexaceae bacterium]NJO07481.1 hypothetical protein [Chloroflexaceae bacterium]